MISPAPIGTIPVGTIHAFVRASGPQRRGHVEPQRLTSIPHLRHCPQPLDLAPGRLSPAPAARPRQALASRFARESCFAVRRSAASAARSHPARMPSRIPSTPAAMHVAIKRCFMAISLEVVGNISVPPPKCLPWHADCAPPFVILNRTSRWVPQRTKK